MISSFFSMKLARATATAGMLLSSAGDFAEAQAGGSSVEARENNVIACHAQLNHRYSERLKKLVKFIVDKKHFGINPQMDPSLRSDMEGREFDAMLGFLYGKGLFEKAEMYNETLRKSGKEVLPEDRMKEIKGVDRLYSDMKWALRQKRRTFGGRQKAYKIPGEGQEGFSFNDNAERDCPALGR